MKNMSLIFLFLCTTVQGLAQSGKLFSVDSELSNSLINKVYQDRNGNIWIATEDGLNRYDGSKFTIYRHEAGDANSLLHNYVRCFLEDRKGNLLIGCFSGLQIYDHASDTFKEIPITLENGARFRPHVTSLVERQNGDILAATSHGILVITIGDTQCYALHTRDIVPGRRIKFIFEDREENLWAATEDRGLLSISKNGEVKSYLHSELFPDMELSAICQNSKGDIFVSSLTSGVYRYNKKTDLFESIPYLDNEKLAAKTLYVNREDELFVGTEGSGLKMYDPLTNTITEGKFSVTTFDFSKAKVHSILEDDRGNIWLGIFQKGLLLLPFQPNNFRYIGHKSVTNNSIGSNCVMSIYEDSSGTIWVGTDSDGLYGIDSLGRQLVHFDKDHKNHSVPSTVLCIYEDSSHDLWVGSYLNGMAKVDRRTGQCTYIKNWYDMDHKPVQRVYCMVEDSYKRLWIGTMGTGLYSLDLTTSVISQYNYTDSDNRSGGNSVHNNWIDCLLITRDNKLYIGTYDGLGCMELTAENISPMGEWRLLGGKAVYALHEDTQGDIWIGTNEGLYCLNRETNEIVSYTIRDGLPNNIVCAIREDKHGYLWISTNYGISRMDIAAKTFINYYSNDGLQGNEFSKGAATADRNGNLWFGGINGVTVFNPEEITFQAKELKVRLTDFYLHDQPVRKNMRSGSYTVINESVLHAKEFQLVHTDNSFTLEFSVMEFSNPERITYSYSMNNSDWITMQPGTNRFSFNNLAPGKYQFNIRAKDYNAYSDTKTISVIIHPAWYASAFARVIYLIISLVIVLLILQQIRHRYLVKQQMLAHQHAKQVDEAKLQFFINISHEIRTPISLIINPLKKLIATDSDSERSKAYSIIRRNSERILHLINQLMDIRKIDKGQMTLKYRETEIVGFLREIYTMFEEQAEAKEINLHFHSEYEKLNVWIDPGNFDKIIVNVLANALKYTPVKGEVDVTLKAEENSDRFHDGRNYYEIIISDTGPGIDQEEIEKIFERFYQTRQGHNSINQGTGIGLHLTRSLVELHHGTIQAENNREGTGATFIIRVPLGKEHLNPDEIEEVPESSLPPVRTHTFIPAVVTEDDQTESKVKSKSKRSVLVVDDDPEIRKYICRELAQEYHMAENANGKEALATILKKAPDLIISDVIMPEMDGVTLCRKIKQNVNINHLPVILLTGRTKEEDKFEGLDMGADAYIGKPFNMDILRKTVDNIIKNREILKNTFRGSQQQDDKIKKISIKSHDDKLLERIMKVVNDNIDNHDLNVEMIAGEIGISRVHLHRKLKELTNQSTRDLIRNVRLKQAATLLSTKPLSITEVAAATGFSNLTHFSNAFKELYGVSPSAYMEMHLKQERDT